LAPPRFAIVGHPNKGKSSLVATLARDDSVPVAAESGTTTRAVHYPMRLDGTVLYELVDTPGFQRARRALAWMRESAVNASDRAASVERFVLEHREDERFSAEVELLSAIVKDAGIIYVVDGAVPYGPEYEPEMEILRWTGRPSLAVINPIGSRAHVGEWKDALGQYFKLVREVDVLTAPLEQRLDLLRAFGELDEEWRPALANAVAALRAERERAGRRAARVVAELLADALRAAPSAYLDPDESIDAARAKLEEDYRRDLRALERRARGRVEAIYQHTAVAREEATLAVVDEDLFAERSWELFGLSRTALAGVGATGGAAAGLGVDVALGGLSMFMGSALGALAGGATAWFAADQLANIDAETLPLGEQVLRVKAGGNKNLPYVLLGRARAHHALVARRSHAARDPLVVPAAGDAGFTADQRNSLAKQFGIIAQESDASERQLAALSETVYDLLIAPISTT
jgi:small GTP-binding protein